MFMLIFGMIDNFKDKFKEEKAIAKYPDHILLHYLSPKGTKSESP